MKTNWRALEDGFWIILTPLVLTGLIWFGLKNSPHFDYPESDTTIQVIAGIELKEPEPGYWPPWLENNGSAPVMIRHTKRFYHGGEFAMGETWLYPGQRYEIELTYPVDMHKYYLFSPTGTMLGAFSSSTFCKGCRHP